MSGVSEPPPDRPHRDGRNRCCKDGDPAEEQVARVEVPESGAPGDRAGDKERTGADVQAGLDGRLVADQEPGDRDRQERSRTQRRRSPRSRAKTSLNGDTLDDSQLVPTPWPGRPAPTPRSPRRPVRWPGRCASRRSRSREAVVWSSASRTIRIVHTLPMPTSASSAIARWAGTIRPLQLPRRPPDAHVSALPLQHGHAVQREQDGDGSKAVQGDREDHADRPRTEERAGDQRDRGQEEAGEEPEEIGAARRGPGHPSDERARQRPPRPARGSAAPSDGGPAAVRFQAS